MYKQRLRLVRYVPVKLVRSSQAATDKVKIPRLVTLTLHYHQVSNDVPIELTLKNGSVQVESNST